MEYREIVAVTGLSGLYQLLTTKSDGAIVRNVGDKTTKFISARQHNVTPLESIEVYTTGDNVRLHEVFQKMLDQESTVPLADSKSNDTKVIKGYFKNIFPEFDDERVYVSDMKKMLKWYEILKANDLLNFPAEEEEVAEGAEAGEENATEDTKGEAQEAAADEKPAKKAKAKKADDADETEATEAAEGEEKPKKAAAKKKKADTEEGAEGEEKPAKKTAAKKKKTEE
ncbi:MAG: DUF5606 domain-containing protein [Bacteroidota bacterium]